MERELCCCLFLIPAHPLWDSLNSCGRPLSRASSLSELIDMAKHRPNSLAVAGPSLTHAQVAVLADATHQAGVPLVLVLPQDQTASREVLISGYLHQLAGPGQTQAVLQTAVNLFEEIRSHEQKLGLLERQLEARKLVERAKGALMAIDGLSEEEAHRRLLTAAMNQRAHLRTVAATVLTNVSTYLTMSGRKSKKHDIDLTRRIDLSPVTG